MSVVAGDPRWANVTLLTSPEPGVKRIVPIAYSTDYVEAMEYFWYAYQHGELSERLFDLTTHILDICEGHYTVWQCRRQLIRALKIDPHQELAFIRQYTVEKPKNYQLWHHREAIVSTMLGTKELLSAELEDLRLVLMDEPKNYHAWQYRQWLIRHYNLWDDNELAYTAELLSRDPFNNSAWNHRYFVLMAGFKPIDWQAELTFLTFIMEDEDRILDNHSFLNYIHAIMAKGDNTIKATLIGLLCSSTSGNIFESFKRLYGQ